MAETVIHSSQDRTCLSLRKENYPKPLWLALLLLLLFCENTGEIVHFVNKISVNLMFFNKLHRII